MIYLDTSYIVKCYVNEPGSPAVLDLVEGKPGLSCCWYGRLEFFSAVKRHVREGKLTRTQVKNVFARLQKDESAGLWNWLAITEEHGRQTCLRIQLLQDDLFLRSADALHLTCASDYGFTEIYSNDRRLLAAAGHFGLTGKNVIS